MTGLTVVLPHALGLCGYGWLEASSRACLGTNHFFVPLCSPQLKADVVPKTAGKAGQGVEFSLGRGQVGTGQELRLKNATRLWVPCEAQLLCALGQPLSLSGPYRWLCPSVYTKLGALE